MLGIAAKDAANALYYEHLVTSLGMAAIISAQGTKVSATKDAETQLYDNPVNTELFPESLTLHSHRWDFQDIEGVESGRVHKTGNDYNHIRLNRELRKGESGVDEAREALKDIEKWICW